MDQTFIQQPFAFAGDKTPVPFPVDLSGFVSFNQGYGVDYQRDPSTDPLAKNIERDKMNYLFAVITEALQQYQTFGTPEFITPANNGGAPYSYGKDARVRYRATPGDPWGVYVSNIDGNVDLPSVVASWRTVDNAAVTPPQFDNDTSIATTAFVQRALGSLSGQTTYTTSATLTVADVGMRVGWNGGAPAILTLPLAAAVPVGGIIFVSSTSGLTVTIQPQGADQLHSGSSAVASMAVNSGDELMLVRGGAGNWIAIGGSAQLPFATVMSGPNWTTPPQFANDKKLATTEFVQRALGSLSGQANYNANTILTVADVGRIAVVGDGCNTITLPLASACVAGSIISVLVGKTSTGVTFVPQGSDIFDNVLAGGSTSQLSSTSDFIQFRRSGSGWSIIAGAVFLKNNPAFGASLAANGYQKLPSGFILQWGTALTNASGVATFNFPIGFPSGNPVYVGGNYTTSGAVTYMGVTVSGVSTTQANYFLANPAGGGVSGATINCIAIGR